MKLDIELPSKKVGKMDKELYERMKIKQKEVR